MANPRAFYGHERQSNAGVAIMAAGVSFVTIPHGLTQAPTVVLAQPRALGTAASWYVPTAFRTPTSFDLYFDAAPGTAVEVDWLAAVGLATGEGR
jgi:hypothetical protein